MAAKTQVAGSTPRVEREAYLSHLEGLVFGEDPREGFFQGNEFLHPEMAFQLTFPMGWQTANLKTAVQGLSPGEDAFVVLTLADVQDQGTALQQFSSQTGVRVLRSNRDPINGVPAASLDFYYQDEGQEGQGQVAFLRYRDTLFQVLAFATPSAWREQGGTLERAVRSFRPLTDPEMLSVRPDRIHLVRVPRAMSLDDFLRGEGALEKVETVRQLNRLHGNPTLEAGMVLKVPMGGTVPSPP